MSRSFLLQCLLGVVMVLGGTWIALGPKAAALMMIGVGIIYLIGLLSYHMAGEEDRRDDRR